MLTTIKGTGASPQASDADLVLSGLRANGVALLRGFAVNEQSFSDLTNQLNDRFTCDPAKIRGTQLQVRNDKLGDAARQFAKVLDKMPKALTARRSNGTRSAPFQPYGINAHNENSYIPGAFPELVWFYCRQPASDGGDTILCDGVEALANLSDRGRAFVEAEPVHYDLVFSAAQWQNLYDVTSTEHLGAILDTVQGLTWTLDARGKLHYAFDAPQTGVTTFGRQPTLRTNVLSRRPFGEVGDAEREMMRNGEPMPAWFISELLDVVNTTSTTLALEAGDVIAIDNSRVMHGRTAFTDTGRRVLTRCGFLRPSLLAA